MNPQQMIAIANLFIIVVGCMGNVLSFMLFSRPHMRVSSVNILLCALSFVDFSLLFLAIFSFVIPGLEVLKDAATANEYLAYVIKFVYPVNLTMQTCSVYIMVMITMERWTAVCRPLQVRIWCTPRKSKIAILIIFLCAVAYNFCRFFEYSIVHLCNDGNDTKYCYEVPGMESAVGNITYQRWLRDPKIHPGYVLYYFTMLYLITHFLVPFSVMALMNGHVIMTMWWHKSERQMLTRQSTTIMLLVVTSMFAFCNTLPFVINIIEYAKPDIFTNDATMAIAYQINDLSNLLVVLNSATTFLVYLVFSEKYRETICFIVKNGCCATMSDFNTYTNMSRTASMRVHSQTQHKLSTCSLPALFDVEVRVTSRSSEMLLKPTTTIAPRAERSVSEYNSRNGSKLKKQKCSLDESSMFRGSKSKMKLHKDRKCKDKFSMGDGFLNSTQIGSPKPPPEIRITVTEEDEAVTP